MLFFQKNAILKHDKNNTFFIVAKAKQKLYWKIRNISLKTNSAENFFTGGLPCPPGYEPGLTSVNFDKFLIKGDHFLFAM